ncbi:YdeI/OmpD-associated family protein [Flavobacterium sp.]|uniref:YdeI/OmpD-associated family protein n=1 Tax=Flavobacterium sp. TaxID=239 RepID=UPI0025BB099A|nr:YdeI/OmpD-associated family protein [Flavobacterium sp.]
MEKPIIDDTFILKKGQEKGAWTFIEMPILETVPKKRNSTVRVRGFIDAFEIVDFNIWAMKKGTFMAVKADIRKAIKKEVGDSVKLVLYLDEAPMVIPDDFLTCLKDEPKLHAKFLKLTDAKKKETIDWIFSAKTDDAVVERMGKVMDKLENAKTYSLPS